MLGDTHSLSGCHFFIDDLSSIYYIVRMRLPVDEKQFSRVLATLGYQRVDAGWYTFYGSKPWRSSAKHQLARSIYSQFVQEFRERFPQASLAVRTLVVR